MLLFLFVSSIFLLFSSVSTSDTIDITGTARCGLTNRFLKSQLAPFLKEFQQIPKNLTITYHALSIGSKIVNGSEIAKCESGVLECELCKLQMCTKKYVVSDMTKLSVIICMQGLADKEHAWTCLPEGNVGKQIKKCASTQEGEKLLLSEPFPGYESFTYPYVAINGKRSMEANKQFKKVICELKSVKNSTPCKTK